MATTSHPSAEARLRMVASDANDSRATRVYLTDQGREAYARLWPHMAQAYEAMFKGIGTEEKAAFVATLQTMLRNIRKHDF